jgi:hypothetical protein
MESSMAEDGIAHPRVMSTMASGSQGVAMAKPPVRSCLDGIHSSPSHKVIIVVYVDGSRFEGQYANDRKHRGMSAAESCITDHF